MGPTSIVATFVPLPLFPSIRIWPSCFHPLAFPHHLLDFVRAFAAAAFQCFAESLDTEFNSPHLCVGFLFLVCIPSASCPPPPPASSPCLLTHNLHTHNLLTHTQLTHTQLAHMLTHDLHTTYSHTTCSHRTCTNTTYSYNLLGRPF